MSFSPDGTRALLDSEVWNLGTGEPLVRIIGSQENEWLAMTPEGFFVASEKGADILSVVRGFDVWSIDQFYQSLYRPDLVREKLAGDPRGLVREAAARLDLTKVLASGNAPAVTLVSPRDGTRATGEQVNGRGRDHRARRRHRPHRVAGQRRHRRRGGRARGGTATRPAAAVVARPRARRGRQRDRGRRLQRAEPRRLGRRAYECHRPAAAARAPARLYVLAVGLNDYADAELKLAYAVPDASALAEALGKAGKGLYEDVEVTLVQDGGVNRERLAAAFTALAGKVRPTDVFAFFIAGHGKTVDGRYYFIPRDFRRAGELITRGDVQAQGIAQEEWQAWFAGIPAKKSVLIFDTCESGTLTGRKPRDRVAGARSGQ